MFYLDMLIFLFSSDDFHYNLKHLDFVSHCLVS